MISYHSFSACPVKAPDGLARWAAAWILRLFLLFAALVGSQQVVAQGAPFNCDVVFYQVRNKAGPPVEMALFKFAAVSNTVTPTAVFTPTYTVSFNIGSIGYNPNDNYMYGVANNSELYRIGLGGVQRLGSLVGLPTGLAVPAAQSIGAFDSGGRYYFAGQGGGATMSPNAIFRLDAVPTLPSSSSITVSFQYNLRNAAGSAVTIANFGDFDFNGAGGVNGKLLGATRQATFGNVETMIRIDLVNDSSSLFGTATVATSTLAFPGGTPASFGVGSAFWDAAANAGVGKFYVYDNNAGTFWEISNPELGAASASPIIAPQPAAPPNFGAAGVGNTDGTSCPISGTRVADVAVTKTDGRTTATTGSIVAYTVTVANNGPYPANYTTVRDPEVVGIKKLSVSCTPSAGPPFPLCPSGLSTATFAAGAQILVFPPGTTLTFLLTAELTGSTGVTLTNTVSATVANDTTDPNLTNNTARDVDVLGVATTMVNSGPSICPAGTVERVPNLLSNGDFSVSTPLYATAGVSIGAVDSWGGAPPGAQQQISRRQLQASNGTGPAIFQAPFPGDGTRSMVGSDWWLLHNGLASAAQPALSIWAQTVTGLVTGRTYTFMFYASNATRPGSTSSTVANLAMQLGNGTPVLTNMVGASVTFAATRSNNETGSDTWTLVQGTFTAVSTTATLAITNAAGVVYAGGQGRQAAIAQVHLRECAPAPNPSITKVGSANFVANRTASYTITVVNPTIGVSASNTFIVDPPILGVTKSTITCVVFGGAVCPSPLNIITFESPGMVIPTLPGQSTVRFIVSVNVTGFAGQRVTNTASIYSSSYSDADPSNNSSSAVSTITGAVSLSLTKTNLVTNLIAGQTTAYTITLANGGPSDVNGLVLTDIPSSGLACTSVTCVAATGPASCPAVGSVTIAALTGSGITLPNMGAPSTLSFNVICGVRATGL